ncbi:MAG TPA: hemolysin family protein [Candidatus Gracilibacteria bacterium]|nr:hemolysin family protein [Candidatus Gracilibacteria bacterium]
MEIFVLVILTLLNGLFSLSEIAFVSVKKYRLEKIASNGNKNAQIVLDLLKSPEVFLSSVQVGITLIGIIAGAYGGATLTEDLVPYVARISVLSEYAYGISFVVVVALITYFTIVFGELLPKTIALNYSEKIALAMARFIKIFSTLTYPFVKLLSFSTKLVANTFGIKKDRGEDLSEDELKYILKVAGKQGVLEKEETQMHQNIFFFSDQKAKNLHTPASDIEWIDINHSIEDIERQIKESPYSKFPICDGTLDNIKGIITAEDFFERRRQKRFSIKRILNEAIFIPENMNAFDILKVFKKHKQYVGMVVDEFGEVEGIITIHDLIEAIIGELPDEEDEFDPEVVKCDDGSFLIDGAIQIHQLNRTFGSKIFNEKSVDYTTLAGFIICHLQKLPKTGDRFEYKGLSFEIVDLDGRRIDKVLIKKGKL